MLGRLHEAEHLRRLDDAHKVPEFSAETLRELEHVAGLVPEKGEQPQHLGRGDVGKGHRGDAPA